MVQNIWKISSIKLILYDSRITGFEKILVTFGENFSTYCKYTRYISFIGMKRTVFYRLLLPFYLTTNLTGVDPTKLYFLHFFFGVKLGHFIINKFFLCVTKMQVYQQKTEKFFVSEEKKFGRIDSWMFWNFP